jgi:hypothetical protein
MILRSVPKNFFERFGKNGDGLPSTEGIGNYDWTVIKTGAKGNCVMK